MNDAKSAVLLIDDDRTSRTMLKLMLQKVGYQVLEAEDGNKGLTIYKNSSPTLILLDAKMPGMDGFECCREIRKFPEGKHIPILMVTGLDDQESVNHAFEAGATDYVTKPVQYSVLMGRMSHLMQSAQAESALRSSEEKYRSLVNSLQEVIFQLDHSGKLIFTNVVWHQWMGYEVESSLGEQFELFLHPAEKQRHRVQFKKVWQHPPQCYRYRSRCLTQGGNVRWVDVQLCSNADDHGNVQDVTGRLIDVTDRTLREQYRSLEYAVSRVLANSDDVSAAIRRTVQAICGNLGFHLGEFWQLDSRVQTLRCSERWHLKILALKTFSDSSQYITFKLGEGVPGKVCQSEDAMWLEDLFQSNHFCRWSLAKTTGLQSLIGIPIQHGQRKIGAILFFSRNLIPQDSDLLRMLTILSRQLSQYIVRKEVEQELQQQHQLMQSELERAAQYMEDLLPSPSAEVRDGHQSCVEVNTLYKPSSALGGDAFDYTWLDHEHLMFYLLDVAGHGIKSALLSVSVLNIIRKRTLKEANFHQPASVLEALNSVFQVNDKGEDYFTLWYGVYNVATRQLQFASAGHPPGVLVVPSNDQYDVHHLDSDNIAIGLMPDFPFESNQCEIPVGSSLYIFSDGVYEIPIGKNNAIWGLDAWTDCLQVHKDAQQTTLDPLFDKVRSINRGEVLEDDFSLLEVSYF